MNSTVRIGILGGTFNPVHLGHLILAQEAAEMCELSKVLFVPCAQPPHKPTAALSPDRHRLAMLQAAVEDNLGFEVSDTELCRGGVSYSIDTVRELKQEDESVELCFIIGSDMLRELHLWKDVAELMQLCRFLTFQRPGSCIEALKPDAVGLAPHQVETLLKDVRIGRQIDISSSDIRYRVAEGMSIRYLVPQAVEMYIAEHNLYRK